MSDDLAKKKIVIDTDFFGAPEPERRGRVTLEPAGISVTLDTGESIFEAAKRVGIVIPSECGGKGTCGRCRIRFPLPARDATYVERQHIDRADIARGIRLSCRSRPIENLTVTILPEPRTGRE